MATVMSMYWPDVTPQLYERVRQAVKWETDVPDGAKLHVAWLAQDGFHVQDVWESQAQFDAFMQERLAPVLEEVGIPGEPKIEFGETLAIFAPNP
jgi:hypothetical protein